MPPPDQRPAAAAANLLPVLTSSAPPFLVPCLPPLQPSWTKGLLLLLAERATRGDPRFAWCYSTPVAEVSA